MPFGCPTGSVRSLKGHLKNQMSISVTNFSVVWRFEILLAVVLCSGPYRMRKKLVRNYLFYQHYPYKPSSADSSTVSYLFSTLFILLLLEWVFFARSDKKLNKRAELSSGYTSKAQYWRLESSRQDSSLQHCSVFKFSVTISRNTTWHGWTKYKKWKSFRLWNDFFVEWTVKNSSLTE